MAKRKPAKQARVRKSRTDDASHTTAPLASSATRAANPRPTSTVRSLPTKLRGQDVRPYLSGAAPGLWASNHLEEANQCKGWQFVAVRTLARMCSQSELKIHRLENQQAVAQQLSRVERKIGKAQRISEPILKSHLLDQLEAKRERLQRRLDRLSKAAQPDSIQPNKTPAQSNHPLVRLLQRPNPDWSGITFIFALVQQIALTGVGLVWCIRNGMGVPLELYVIPTGLAIPRLPTAEYPQGSYWITPLSVWGMQPQDTWQSGAMGQALLTGAQVDARDVKRISNPHPIFLTDGLSPLSAGSLWVDLGNEMDRAAWYGFQNSERPGMIFTRKPEIDPDQADVNQFREDLRADHAGTPNTGRHLLLPPGVEADPRSMTPKEVEFVGSRPQIRDMNLALHGVTPQAAGISETSSFAGFWASIKQTTQIACQPMCDLIGGELTEFVGSDFGSRHEVTYSMPAIDDPQVLDNRLRTYIQAGNMVTVNEARAICGFPPLPDEQGKAFLGADKVAKQGTGTPQSDLLAQEKPAAEESQRDRKDEQQSKETDKGPGIRSPFRDAQDGQRRNGKSFAGIFN